MADWAAAAPEDAVEIWEAVDWAVLGKEVAAWVVADWAAAAWEEAAQVTAVGV